MYTKEHIARGRADADTVTPLGVFATSCTRAAPTANEVIDTLFLSLHIYMYLYVRIYIYLSIFIFIYLYLYLYL